MRKIYTLAFLTVILLATLATAPAQAACSRTCPNGDSCSGGIVCCCIWADDDWTAYCGPSTGNPCFAAAASVEEDSLQARYAAIFSADAPEESAVDSVSK